MILNYKQFINEALLPSQFRKYVKEFNRERYKDIFQKYKEEYDGDKNAYRIYLPLVGGNNPIKNEIEDFLKQNNYIDIDYIKGTCKHEGAKNKSKIGTILTKLKNSALMKKFVEDPQRKTGDDRELLVCISRHPYDIAGADTDRDWTDCMTMSSPVDTPRLKKIQEKIDDLRKEYNEIDKKMRNISDKDFISDDDRDNYKKLSRKMGNVSEEIYNLESQLNNRREQGCNVKFLIFDVKEGSLISYLIKKDDKNINNPLAVLNIKPFINEKDPNDYVLMADKNMYGKGIPEFKKTVDLWLNGVNIQKSGTFKLHKNLYNDGQTVFDIYTEKDYEEMSKSIIEDIETNHILNLESQTKLQKLPIKHKQSIIESLMKKDNVKDSFYLIRNYLGTDSYIKQIPNEKIVEYLKQEENCDILSFFLYYTMIMYINLNKKQILEILEYNKNSSRMLTHLIQNNIINYDDISSFINFDDLDNNVKYNIITKMVENFDKDKEKLKKLFDDGYITIGICPCGCKKYVLEYANSVMNISINDNDVKKLKTIGIEFPEITGIEKDEFFKKKMIDFANKYKYNEDILPLIEESKLRRIGYIDRMCRTLEELFDKKPIEKSNYDVLCDIYSGVTELRERTKGRIYDNCSKWRTNLSDYYTNYMERGSRHWH